MLSDINQGDKDGQRFEKNSSLTGPLIYVSEKINPILSTRYTMRHVVTELSRPHPTKSSDVARIRNFYISLFYTFPMMQYI